MSGTAKIHDAELKPGKLELLAAWLPSQRWFDGDAGDLTRVAAYRFVDPDGEVGIETLLVASGGTTYQVPLTYRAEPLDDELAVLVGTLEHSDLGTRYCYDATTDPVYVAELIRVIHEADDEAELSRGEKSMTVRGSGITTVSNASMEAARLVRVLDGDHVHTAQPLGTLTGSWTQDGAERTEVLATIR
jgi:maltokinase-like protein